MKVRCTTYNLYQFLETPFSWYEKKNKYSTDEWYHKVDFVRNQLRTLNSDIVGFQEVFSINALKSITEEIGYSYFATVEEPDQDPNDQDLFIRPVCAIASKYPISKIEAPRINREIVDELGLSQDFTFSRLPVKALISFSDTEELCVYVCHLKSKRPIISAVDDLTKPIRERVFQSAKATSRGQISALIQRGAEATCLYHDAIEELENPACSGVLILGDLNDYAQSVAVESLSNQSGRFELSNLKYDEWPQEAKLAGHQAKLYDAFNLIPNQTGDLRPPTHYFRGTGSVLDYIFVSNSLNPKNPSATVRLVSHLVSNDHIKPGSNNQKTKTDHGLVTLTLETMSENN